jgi:hypothetical protein
MSTFLLNFRVIAEFHIVTVAWAGSTETEK